MPDQLLDTNTGTDTDTADQDHSPNHADIEAIVITPPTEAIPSHITRRIDATIEVFHDAVAPVLIIITMTHHTKDHPRAEVPQLIPEITADPDHVLHINQVRKPHLNLHPVLAGQQ